ncbi:MAG: Motility protein N-terminal domain protein [Gemmatimonadetes bacterium]|nr:Motility protein N-terminal domain protein [Gemmatimonadota bacterium]
MAKSGAKIIIIRKKKKAHAAHHGGSWKVAYADFVTAMMAFFMVMWILGMDQDLKKSIEGYFSNPVGFKKGYSAGRSPLSSGSSPGSVQTTPLRLVSRIQQQEEFVKTGAKIKARLEGAGLGALANVEIVTTNDGLRIELAEGAEGETFFPVASAQMKPIMRNMLAVVGAELSTLTNAVIIEGHTDARPFNGLYSNWELSSDRANAARRVLEVNGVKPFRVREVRGMADRDTRPDADSYDPRNRRITIYLPFNESSQQSGPATAHDSTGPAARLGPPALPQLPMASAGRGL